MSYIMSAALNGLLRRLARPEFDNDKSMEGSKFFPFLSMPLMDEWSLKARLDPQTFPGPDAEHCVKFLQSSPENIKIQSGEFVNVYSKEIYWEKYDMVVTSFFMDVCDDLVCCPYSMIHFHSTVFLPF